MARRARTASGSSAEDAASEDSEHAATASGRKPAPSRPSHDRDVSSPSSDRSSGEAPTKSKDRDSSPPSASSGLFVGLRSRVGKRYQADVPEFRAPHADGLDGGAKRMRMMRTGKESYSATKASELGEELDKYLKLAKALRDGATFDSEEQVTAVALQHLHRFNYNVTDAACALYARHSVEIPKSPGATEPTITTKSSSHSANNAHWIASFYALMRQSCITTKDYEKMVSLEATAGSIDAIELGVLQRLIRRLRNWLDSYRDVQDKQVNRSDLLRLLFEAEDMAFIVDEKVALEKRISEFDSAYSRLKDGIERGYRRHQVKSQLVELVALFDEIAALKINYPEYQGFLEILDEARELKSTISSMLAEERMNLVVMRDVMAKVELLPVNFEKEMEDIQRKVKSAESWLAKVRQCVPRRRGGRRGIEPKKVDLDSIRALVEDAPCEDSTDLFEMQDLLECADEWAKRVKEAIEGGADITLQELKSLMNEGKEMPVDMAEQTFLEAEISAREWCANATEMLKARKSLARLEETASRAMDIRKQLHPKKQSRWKPQIERDIHAALDAARRWVSELRDVIGASAFDKLFPSSASSFSHSASSSSEQCKSSGSFGQGKKAIDAAMKVIEKAKQLGVDVTSYVDKLEGLMDETRAVQSETITILQDIGVAMTQPEAEHDSTDSSHSVGEQMGDPKPMVADRRGGAGGFSRASAMLDRISALPFMFDEAVCLNNLIQREREWSQRVRDALPPRQSRKKRQMKQQVTINDLQILVEQSRRLHFEFPEETRMLGKEIADVTAWQQKARRVVEDAATSTIAAVAKNLKSHDISVHGDLFGKIQLDASNNTKDEMMENGIDRDLESKKDPTQIGLCDVTMKNEHAETNDDAKPVVGIPVAAVPAVNAVDRDGDSVMSTEPTATAPSPVMELLRVDSILDCIRHATGCTRRSDEESAGDSKQTEGTVSLLDPLLAMVEGSIADMTRVEAEVGEPKTPNVEDLPSDSDGIRSPSDNGVKQLETWRTQILRVADEGTLFNVVAPELDALTCVADLLEWHQTSRAFFYGDTLPLHDLVTKGQAFEARLQEVERDLELVPAAMELLRDLLWPLPYLVDRDRVEQSWCRNVQKAMEDKHATVPDIQRLLQEAHDMNLDVDACKPIFDEVKKAKLWLAKLKKRLKSLMTKSVNRLSMSVAKSLVEEGEDISIELPAFDLLKEHTEVASDWERRVQESGIESGHAKIAELISLLEEYDHARLVIDLDMHRDVLKSATERFCICRQPYDGFMIGCDHCDDWFHDHCIGLSKEKAEKVENYTCPSCMILDDMRGALARALAGQDKLWVDVDYAKNYERLHNNAARKVKREEKAVERSEMLLFSCNNHLKQLQSRIQDIERAKSCLPFKPGIDQERATAIATQDTEVSASTANADGLPKTTAAPAVTTATASATDEAHGAGGVTVPSAGSTVAVPSIDSLQLVQHFSSILLPTAQFSVSKATPKQPASDSTSTESTSSVPEAAGTCPSPPDASTPNGIPNMLAPMLAKLSENTERLSALLVAGGVEQQLSKMKMELAEVTVQVQDLQEAIRVGKERLGESQQALDSIRQSFQGRQRGLPLAKIWVQQTIGMLNAPESYTRARSQTFLAPEFANAIEAAKCMKIDLFPEVRAYIHLLRMAGWTMYVVRLLQQHPSKEELVKAIMFATEHGLCEAAKTIGPLRAIIGRVDTWISKVQKCLCKSVSAAQKITRLRSLMNEYTKLPLTWSEVGTLEEFLRLSEMEGHLGMTAKELLQAQADAEATAIAAIAASAVSLTSNGGPSKFPRKRQYTKRDKSSASGSNAKSTKRLKKAASSSSQSSTPPQSEEPSGGPTEEQPTMVESRDVDGTGSVNGSC